MLPSEFIHLHTHSHYSLLQALPKIDDLIRAAKESGMKALALTDNGNLYGAIEFYKKCKKEEIKPIIGVDFYVALNTRHDKKTGVDKRRYRLVCLAKNETGYKNLIKLVTISHLEGFYYKPRVDKEILEKYSEGLVAINPSFSGEATFELKIHDFEKAKAVIAEHKKIFGENNYYLEISHHPEINGHDELRKTIKKIAEETKTPLVAGQEVFYIRPEDKAARNTLLSIQGLPDFGENAKLTDANEDFSFINLEKALEYFKETPEAILNTVKIKDECNLEISLGNWVFPKVELPEKRTADDELRRLVYRGLKEKKMRKTPEVKKRLEYELGVIKNKGYAPYFLAVEDLMRFAHKNKIVTNIRGSVSGSLVTYLSDITKINPLEYDIPFERFLNPDRPSPPDIDMDFADDRRDEVIQYTVKKYGRENVAQIGTFGTMAARGAVRDVARALGHDYSTGDKIAKLIPQGVQGFPMTIDRALEEEAELLTLYKNDDDTKEIIDMAKKIEGCARHISVHAAGVVISPRPLLEYTPLQMDPKGKDIITQYDMYSIEEAGLLKFDFLGIKNLTILNDAIRRANKIRDLKIDLDEIPLDDKKTFEMLSRGETMGLFQLNGQGITRFLKDLKPSNIDDINAMVALYRPGPLQFIPQYIARKHNARLIKYADPALEPILERTYGILVYQDDLLVMAHELAGYSWLEVDKFRKAVGKKIPKLMAEQKEKFISGCIKTKNWSKERAEEIWAWIEPFAAYGFNKAHSVSYGKVAYQTAYMKANFPVEYMAAVLTADSGDVEKIAEGISECKRLGIKVLPPNINESLGAFTVVDNDGKLAESKGEAKAIRFGLYTIKNLGQGISDVIIEEAKKNGKFESITDFLTRVLNKNLNKKSLEALIKSGAMDTFGERGRLLGNLETFLEYNKEMSHAPESQDSLFTGIPEIKRERLALKKVPEATQDEKLGWEKELLGLYLSGHPLEKHEEKLKKNEYSIKRAKIGFKAGMTTVVSGIVENLKEILTKKGEKMAFARLADFEESIEIVIFPETYKKYRKFLAADECLSVKGRVSERNGEISIVAEAVKPL
ncbi:DNA polymerase III subunit alpha [Candidatus Campbellbacteria bacterium CG11_big_fil_rev_8_21_14_0_20_44_21]|uniref:DNA polymerase III subunit alpha n=1 Tax=Candidatus Campbellbacteria bacterium CG22_combo_CG10-13_8_21_14_all_43_18 TaxID=1974530 RepID=A0A2H0DWM5_9BACT|nr:MAG: DNA polymerase III subunit alpha [Candidatus Campbellbacteria bacterium CG22_combo_CG10-13_8_21_14_all_43_18]PIR24370.1 MAG: DNA polymerase III subunit alpha [Candidatus Campbellbacteria bacterium CG11_big_fil_rev_8_21_14_0_20_44_21]